MSKRSKHMILREKQWRKEQATYEKAELEKHKGSPPLVLYWSFRADRLEAQRRGY